MKKFMLVAYVVLTCISHVARADELEEQTNGEIRHTSSGWVFPNSVGSFERQDSPKLVNETEKDAFARYRFLSGKTQLNATVFVYGSDTPAADATYEAAKLAIDPKRNSFLVDTFAEGMFRVGESPSLYGDKLIYKYGFGENSSLDYLYFFDTGPWVVKVRVSAAGLERNTFEKIDEFVRLQRWQSLGLTPETCSGAACNAQRVIAHHGPLAEWIAIMVAQKNIREIFPKTGSTCSAAELSQAMNRQHAVGKDGKPQSIEMLSSCKLSGASQVTMFRMYLDQEVLSTIETKSPESLSLRGPVTFFAFLNGKKSVFTQMHDGVLASSDLQQVLNSVPTNRQVDFAEGDSKGRKFAPRIRLME